MSITRRMHIGTCTGGFHIFNVGKGARDELEQECDPRGLEADIKAVKSSVKDYVTESGFWIGAAERRLDIIKREFGYWIEFDEGRANQWRDDYDCQRCYHIAVWSGKRGPDGKVLCKGRVIIRTEFIYFEESEYPIVDALCCARDLAAEYDAPVVFRNSPKKLPEWFTEEVEVR